MKVVVLIALLLCGCSTASKVKPAADPVHVATITLAWDCDDWISHSTYDTGLITSIDLTNWTEIICFPYSNYCVVTVPKTNHHQSYRAFSRPSTNTVIQ